MLRRVGILGVLLLALSGFAPATWACAELAQQMDCCPPDQPCDEADGTPSVAAESGLCCDLESTPTRSIPVFASQKEDRSAKASAPDYPAAASFASPQTISTYRGWVRIDTPPVLDNNQQQTYLLTGRLRL